MNGGAALVRKLTEEAVNQGRIEELGTLTSPDVVLYDNNQTFRGTRQVADRIAKLLTAFPDLTFTLDEIIECGDRVVTRWHAEGTHLGRWNDRDPTGGPLSYWGVSIFSIRDGRIAEAWVASTLPSALSSLGLD